MRGTLLRHFSATADLVTPPPPPSTCQVTGKIRYAAKVDVPTECGQKKLTPYWCGYCESWHCSSRSEQDRRTIRRRLGKGKLYPGDF